MTGVQTCALPILRQAQNIKIDQSLIKVKALEKKVDDLLKGKKQTGQKAELADKRYAFP